MRIPRSVFRNATRSAIATFGQLLLEEGGRWAVREVERRRTKKSGAGKAAPEPPPSRLAPLIAAGAQYLQAQWAHLAAARASKARGAVPSGAGDDEGAFQDCEDYRVEPLPDDADVASEPRAATGGKRAKKARAGARAKDNKRSGTKREKKDRKDE